MTGFLQTRNADIRAAQRQVDADLWRRGHSSDLKVTVSAGSEAPALVIRAAGEKDFAGIRRLYQLEGRRPDSAANLLLAEVEGELLAALPLDGGSPVADPFRPTAELVELLRIRADQLHAEAPRSDPLKRTWRALSGSASRPAVAPVASGNARFLIRHDGE